MKISTIIPTYNRADLIDDTLRSVLGQTRAPDEVIVVDDGSTDGTLDLVSKYGSQVKLVRQNNAGPGPARNLGFSLSTGDIIHFMDSDDISSLNTYSVQSKMIEKGADIVYGPWLKTRFKGKTLIPDRRVLQQRPVPYKKPIDRLILAGRWVTVFQPCMFQRSLIEAAGPYRTDLKPSEDTEMLYRLTRLTRSIVHTNETILLYRVHPENQISSQNLKNRQRDWAYLCSILAKHAETRDDLDFWTREATRLRQVETALKLDSDDLTYSDARLMQPRHFDSLRIKVEGIRQRIEAKVRFLLTGDRSNRNFAPGPLSETQKKEITQLGYTF